MPMFSVIIPTRNRADYLKSAVASVLQQTLSDFELLIVNDGADVVDAFADGRVRVLDNAQRGAVPARNLGVAEATGHYVAFLDDDDVWCSTVHLENAFAVHSQGVDFYFSDGVMRMPDGSARNFSHDANVTSLAHDNTILISTVCYARHLHDKLGEFDTALPYYWDWDWYLRVARGGFSLKRNIEAAAEILVHAQNMSGDANIDQRRANLDLLCHKHGLGAIELKNHADFAQSPSNSL
jgi:glycosyltransferase involved in cell wall biosynthesis